VVPQEEQFRKREEALKKKDLELQESLIRFSRWVWAGVVRLGQGEHASRREALPCSSTRQGATPVACLAPPA
jgi:hypothetical protein